MTETTSRLGTAEQTASPSLSELVSGILNDAQHLIKQQANMLRAELREDFRHSSDVAKYMSVGAVLTTIGALFLSIGLVFLLNWLVPTLPLWACWAIFGAVYVAAGVAAIIAGRRILDTYNPLPDKTLTALEENLTWKTTNPQS
jgi:hypothetical protein